MRPPQDLIFPRNPEEFYRLRDDRTNRCVANRGYQSIRTSVSIDSDVARTISGQAMMLTTCNLLSRWCRRRAVVCSADRTSNTTIYGGSLLRDIILLKGRLINPIRQFFIFGFCTHQQPSYLH